MHKYDKIKHYDNKEALDVLAEDLDIITIEEKIDGANFRFNIGVDGTITYGSRTRELIVGGDDDTGWANFTRIIEYLDKTLAGKPIDAFTNLTFHGEAMIKHTINYDWEKHPPFIGFDVYHEGLQKYMSDEAKRIAFYALGLKCIAKTDTMTAKEARAFLKEPVFGDSAYGHTKVEGYVLKNYGKGIFTKVVQKEFQEKNKEIFGKHKREANDDSERVAIIYCTNARIHKMIAKLTIEQGMPLATSMMHVLPTVVTDDIWTEHWNEIVHTAWTVNFHKLRSHISKRCYQQLSLQIERKQQGDENNG